MERRRLSKKRGTHVPQPKKWPPNQRLAKLRAILQKSRPDFAQLVGVPAHTIRSYERGDRRLPEQIAERISYATWISSDWLLDDKASAENPRAWGGSEYTLDFYRTSGIQSRPLLDVDSDSRFALVYMPASHCVARLLRVALAHNKHLLCRHLLEKEVSKLTKELRLADSFQKEMPSALHDDGTRTWMMGGTWLANPNDTNVNTYNAALVLSSAMLFEWSAALEGTEANRTMLVAKLDFVKGLIQQSFEKRPPNAGTAPVKSLRKTQSASRSRPRKA